MKQLHWILLDKGPELVEQRLVTCTLHETLPNRIDLVVALHLIWHIAQHVGGCEERLDLGPSALEYDALFDELLQNNHSLVELLNFREQRRDEL